MGRTTTSMPLAGKPGAGGISMYYEVFIPVDKAMGNIKAVDCQVHYMVVSAWTPPGCSADVHPAR